MPLLNWYKDQDQLNLLDKDTAEIVSDQGEEIRYKTSFGHTPYMIHPYTEKYI